MPGGAPAESSCSHAPPAAKTTPEHAGKEPGAAQGHGVCAASVSAVATGERATNGRTSLRRPEAVRRGAADEQAGNEPDGVEAGERAQIAGGEVQLGAVDRREEGWFAPGPTADRPMATGTQDSSVSCECSVTSGQWNRAVALRGPALAVLERFTSQTVQRTLNCSGGTVGP